RCRRPSQIPRGDSRPTTSIRRREPKSPTRRSASSCARSEFSRSRSGVSRRSSSMRASTLTFVNGWAQAGPHGLRIAGRRPSSWIDRNIWRSDAKKTTPAHMYMDGVEYFPVSRYVLWGYQFKSVAALGPILGPFIGITYGWLPALLWITGGNFFIGWLQDYGSMMLSVRKEGRSFGPITYEFTGAKGRTNLLAFVLFYLIIISAAFIALIAVFWNSFNGTTFVPTIGILI